MTEPTRPVLASDFGFTPEALESLARISRDITRQMTAFAEAVRRSLAPLVTLRDHQRRLAAEARAWERRRAVSDRWSRPGPSCDGVEYHRRRMARARRRRH